MLAACTAATPIAQATPTPTREPNTISVSVLLDLSGPRAPNGAPQRDAMQLWLDTAQAATPKVKLRVKFVDVAGSDARVLIELRRASVDDHADAIVIGVPIALDDTFAEAARVAGVPILLTLPTPEPMTTAGGRWTFALAPTPDTVATALVNDLLARDIRAPSLLASDETPPAVIERSAFAAELGRHGFTAPTPLVVSGSDAAAKIKGPLAVARSVVFAGAAAAYGDAIRSMTVAPTAPRVYLSYLTETGDVAGLREQSALVTWPGSRYLATISVAPLGPRATFVRSFTARIGAPSTIAATAYDALGLLDAAAELAPTQLDPAMLRLRLDTLTFAGVATTYTFTPAKHAAFASSDLAYLRWNAQQNAPLLAANPKDETK